MLSTVAVVVMPGSAAFELGVACEVFGIDRTAQGVPAFDFRVCAEHPGRLLDSTGVGLVAPHGLDAVAGADAVIVPAVSGTPERFPEPVLAAADAGATLVSVCSGIFPLAEAGLLGGRRCTLHWRQVAAFATRYPDVTLDPDVLFVDEGSVITSAGTAAGIDALLHLVRRELGTGAATVIARHMVVAPQRDGGQRQFVTLPVPEEPCDSLQPLLDWMIEHLDAEFDVARLSRLAAMSGRTFARRFVAETGTTPLRWLTTQRILHARRLLEETSLTVEDIARACGLGSGALLRHHFRRAVGLTPADYRRSFRVEPARAA
ncbi:helix-turn-helix domain-containing protein [Actinospica durhamensis]|uniref:Helix-turn-helix domain-containing protein n=1 Tax=Actinospica durhamensis TaxID=1508375 RepID=A0A941EUY9_9ACTN|nr:helix-turn-helix domain-containing protein [Actinospica durhamensis]MBR7838622.1 helix-turn-helix domain-containing protein [Actinospica durhamensis]